MNTVRLLCFISTVGFGLIPAEAHYIISRSATRTRGLFRGFYQKGEHLNEKHDIFAMLPYYLEHIYEISSVEYSYMSI